MFIFNPFPQIVFLLCCIFSPVIVEIPHFGSMRGKERELIVLRSDNGDTWKEHQSDARPEDLTELLAGMDEGKGKVIQRGSTYTNDSSKSITTFTQEACLSVLSNLFSLFSVLFCSDTDPNDIPQQYLTCTRIHKIRTYF